MALLFYFCTWQSAYLGSVPGMGSLQQARSGERTLSFQIMEFPTISIRLITNYIELNKFNEIYIS